MCDTDWHGQPRTATDSHGQPRTATDKGYGAGAAWPKREVGCRNALRYGCRVGVEGFSLHYTKLGQHTVNAVRLAEVLQVLVRHGFADLLRRAGFHDGLPARVLYGLNLKNAPSGEPATFGQRMRAALAELGPTFIKLGQVLSTRPDIVGAGIAQALAELQDRVPPVPFEAMADTLELALGDRIENVFTHFDKEAVASASLSQVYHATLKSGEEVAVKIQRPGVRKTIESDLGLMRQVAEWMDSRSDENRWFDAPGIVTEFERSVHREMDFEIEAGIVKLFREKLKHRSDVLIPQVYEDYGNPTVLVMEWVDGVRVDQFDEYEARNCDREAIALLAANLVCELVFELRVFHADPHPGNIFITRDNRLALLDLGMAGHIEVADVTAIADLFLAVFYQDSSECVSAMLNLTPSRMVENREAFEHEIAEFIAFEAQSILSGGQVARGVERAIQILRTHRLELAPRFSLLLKALATIETVGRTLVPDFDFVMVLQPYVEHMVRERYDPLRMVKDMRRDARSLLRLSGRVPEDLGSLLQQLRQGRLKILVQHEKLEKLAATIDRASNRQAVSMITGALIVGSSFIIAEDAPMRQVGIAGFIFAGMLGCALVISILWSRKF